MFVCACVFVIWLLPACGPCRVAEVLDVEWAASDRPVLACADGCVRVMDIACSVNYSPVDDYQGLSDAVLCPHGLPAHSSMLLRSLLQHQPWRSRYQLDCRTDDEPATCNYSVFLFCYRVIFSDISKHAKVCFPPKSAVSLRGFWAPN